MKKYKESTFKKNRKVEENSPGYSSRPKKKQGSNKKNKL